VSADIEGVLVEVLAGHVRRDGIRDLRVHCWCGWASEPRQGMPAHRTHVAAEQAKALREFMEQDEGIAAAMDGVYEVEGRLPDPSVRQYAVAVLTAIFGGPS